MTTRTLLQLLAGPSGVPGEHGFTLTGIAREGLGLCRVMLRRMEPWHRYPNPRIVSHEWDVRVYVKFDSAFSVLPDMTVADLEQLEESYSFPDGADELAGLSLNGDPVFDRAVVWARRVTGAPELPAPAPASPNMIPVRYAAKDALASRGVAIPMGRSTPPFRPILPLTKDALRPQYLSGANAPASTARAAAPAAPSPRPATPDSKPALPTPPSVAAPATPAPPVAAPAAKPSVAKPPSRANLTERLQTLRSKAIESESDEGDDN